MHQLSSNKSTFSTEDACEIDTNFLPKMGVTSLCYYNLHNSPLHTVMNECDLHYLLFSGQSVLIQ